MSREDKLLIAVLAAMFAAILVFSALDRMP